MLSHLQTSTFCPGCSALIDEASLIAIYGHCDDADHEGLPPRPASLRVDPSPLGTDAFVPLENDRLPTVRFHLSHAILSIIIIVLSVVLER
jgi:hypothetical protein